MKTAFVHDWLVGYAGGEKVLEALLEVIKAPVYTLIQNHSVTKLPPFSSTKIHTSFLQKLPHVQTYYRHLLPFFPKAIQSLDLSSYDLIFSCSHAVAKGAITHNKQLHICYCFTPMRYAWDLYHFHLSHLSLLKRLVARPTLHALRQWDRKTAGRVDYFVAISHTIAERIKTHYERDAEVIYPPVDTHLFLPALSRENYYFSCSRCVPYKRLDLLVRAFQKLPDRKLVLIGDGPELSYLKSIAPFNVEFLGHQPAPILRETLAKAKAFLFAAEEDFGIVTVEAQSAGVPVIAYGKGGSTETVLPGKTGLFFKEQTEESLIEAIKRFEQMEDTFDTQTLVDHAKRFSKERFQKEMQELVISKLELFESRRETSFRSSIQRR